MTSFFSGNLELARWENKNPRMKKGHAIPDKSQPLQEAEDRNRQERESNKTAV